MLFREMQIKSTEVCQKKKTKQKENIKEIDTKIYKPNNKKKAKWASISINVNFLYSIKISGKTLKFDNIEVNKKEFHASKQGIDLNLVDVNKIVTSDKFRHSGKGFKYFIGYKGYNT